MNGTEEFVRYIISNLIDDESAYDVSTVENSDCDTIIVQVKKEEIGRVIGKQGRIARSMRTIIRSYGAKQNKKIMLDIVEM